MPEPKMAPQPPVLNPNDPLATYWNKPLSTVATVPALHFEPHEAERHRIFSLLLMSLVHAFWNGNKDGMTGEYPYRAKQKWEGHPGLYQGGPLNGEPIGQYLGHNIACLAVDGNGDIIDFDFNHNNVFGSSVEHAESRLVRRIYSLGQINDSCVFRSERSADKIQPVAKSLLTDVTIYTSLESCAQCSGIMALAEVKEVVYLQKDFGQFCVGNIMWNLTHGNQKKPALPAPFPIAADTFDLPYYERLNDEYIRFTKTVGNNKPFWKGLASAGKPAPVDAAPSITSFLCSDIALEIFAEGADRLHKMHTSHPDARPPGNSATRPRTNAEVLAHAKDFLNYAVRFGDRGTMHKL